MEYKVIRISDWKTTISDRGNTRWLKEYLGLSDQEKLVLKRKTEGNAGVHFQYIHFLEGSEIISSGVNLHLYTNGDGLIQNYLIDVESLSIDPLSAERPYLIYNNNRLISCAKSLNTNNRQQWEFRDEFNQLILSTDRYRYFKDTTVKAKVFMGSPRITM